MKSLFEMLKNDYCNKKLIRIIESERYGEGEIDFRNNFNFDYVQKYEVLTGSDRDNFLRNKAEKLNAHWEKEMEDSVNKFKMKLEQASEFIDMSRYIDRIYELRNPKCS